MSAATAIASRGSGLPAVSAGRAGWPSRSRSIRWWRSSSGAGLVPASASAILADRVNAIRVFSSAPRVIATYSHCRSSLPVTTGMPIRTVRPCAEWPVTA